MIHGIGTDIVSMRRIEELWDAYGNRFARKILSGAERGIIPEKNTASFLAGRFAAKEAIIKALGKGGGIGLADITIANDASGKPYCANADELFRGLDHAGGPLRITLSISHEREYATAMAVVESV